MACIDPDGVLTTTGKLLLRSLEVQPLPPPDIAFRLSEPLFKVRGNLRELSEAGLIREDNGLYALTSAGRKKLEE